MGPSAVWKPTEGTSSQREKQTKRLCLNQQKYKQRADVDCQFLADNGKVKVWLDQSRCLNMFPSYGVNSFYSAMLAELKEPKAN